MAPTSTAAHDGDGAAATILLEMERWVMRVGGIRAEARRNRIDSWKRGRGDSVGRDNGDAAGLIGLIDN
jgi:hypothetical protein